MDHPNDPPGVRCPSEGTRRSGRRGSGSSLRAKTATLVETCPNWETAAPRCPFARTLSARFLIRVSYRRLYCDWSKDSPWQRARERESQVTPGTRGERGHSKVQRPSSSPWGPPIRRRLRPCQLIAGLTSARRVEGPADSTQRSRVNDSCPPGWTKSVPGASQRRTYQKPALRVRRSNSPRMMMRIIMTWRQGGDR
ncbi:hypothetical protein BJX63DRAFT_74238 [Aspergillus granulosus]|uniref:Uncharacterized protein n=1 Tax=Aspergillus granulosus TaxID=176169 RepID=A0ABR4GWC2_9EURO